MRRGGAEFKLVRRIARGGGGHLASRQGAVSVLHCRLEDPHPEPLKKVGARLAELADWTAEPIHQAVIDTGEELELKLGKVAQPIRVAVSGGAVSPPIDQTLALLGKEKTLERLDKALEFIASAAE